jgi:hypothetical protein
MPSHFKGTQKNFEMCDISCHSNTKFLHAIAEVCLYLMHKKWNSYMYLEPHTTIWNFEVRITTFAVTTRSLQFTHCADTRFLCTACENQLPLLLPAIQFWVTHFKTLPYTKSSITFSIVHCSAFLQFFQYGTCFFKETHTHNMHIEIPPPV